MHSDSPLVILHIGLVYCMDELLLDCLFQVRCINPFQSTYHLHRAPPFQDSNLTQSSISLPDISLAEERLELDSLLAKRQTEHWVCRSQAKEITGKLFVKAVPPSLVAKSKHTIVTCPG